jgi:hypothetical protein
MSLFQLSIHSLVGVRGQFVIAVRDGQCRAPRLGFQIGLNGCRGLGRSESTRSTVRPTVLLEFLCPPQAFARKDSDSKSV